MGGSGREFLLLCQTGSRGHEPAPPDLCLCPGPGLCEVLRSGALSRAIGPGYVPACRTQDGGFSPVQCDPTLGSCWCVLGSGEEVPGTRVVGGQPACESKSCPLEGLEEPPLYTSPLTQAGRAPRSQGDGSGQETQRATVTECHHVETYAHFLEMPRGAEVGKRQARNPPELEPRKLRH